MLAAASRATRSEYSTSEAPSSPATNFLTAAASLTMVTSPVCERRETVNSRCGRLEQCATGSTSDAADPAWPPERSPWNAGSVPPGVPEASRNRQERTVDPHILPKPFAIKCLWQYLFIAFYNRIRICLSVPVSSRLPIVNSR